MAAAVAFESSGNNPEEARKAMRECMLSHVDQSIRQAISSCWMVLPDGKRTFGTLETEIQRLVKRALKDFQEDAQAFGVEMGP
jgi:hypothetical protein